MTLLHWLRYVFLLVLLAAVAGGLWSAMRDSRVARAPRSRMDPP